MYRLKRDVRLSESLNAEFEKDGTKAMSFACIAAFLSLLDSSDRKFSFAGINLELKEQFFINGIFCALALYFGISMFLTGINLYGAGWPKTYKLFYKRYIFNQRNKTSYDKYKPIRTKRFVRFYCLIFNSALCVLFILLASVYLYGVTSTFPDLMRIFLLLLDKILY